MSQMASGLFLALSAAFAIILITQPVGNETQFLLAMTVIVAMIATWRFRMDQTARQIFLALGLLIVCRYVYWRTTATLPPMSMPIDFAAGVLLYAGEMFCVVMLFISLFIVADPLRRPPARRLRDADLPTVDVFVPTYNEDRDLLATTLAAAKALDYPSDKLTVYLLDDGGTDQKCASSDPIASAAARQRRIELSAMCRDLGVIYLTRALNQHAKAGNLNAGLQHATGELVAVFDADHAPVREFLRETVGHFRDDPRCFLVQTPHFFLNPDPVEKNLSTWNRMPSENEMFYSVVQRGLDKWNGAFFCGSAAVLRRAALDEAGGFSGVSITEDCETALELHAKGWNSRYVDKPLIAGLQPETFVSFIGQRSRWCRGMIQIFMLKNPILRPGLTLPQRLAYISSNLFWLFPLPRLIFMIAPLLYIFFDLKLYVANIPEFVAYTLTYLAVSVMLQNYLYGQVRWPWVSELYEYVQSFFLARAIISVVMNPRKPTFNVTAKGLTSDKDHLSELALPYFVMFGILCAGMAMAAYRYATEPVLNELLLVVGGWNLFNLVIAGVALGVVSERRERRKSQRLVIERTGTLSLGAMSLPVLIDDASIGGVRVRPRDPAMQLPRGAGQIANLTIEGGAPGIPVDTIPVILRRTTHDAKGATIGLEFFRLQPIQYRVVADLMYGSGVALERFRDGRRSGSGVIGGTFQFVRWSLREVARGFGFVWAERAKRRLEDAAESTPSALPAPPDPVPAAQRG